MSETYGSDGVRVACLHDEKGKNLKGESLFFNLYDYWTLLHAKIKSLYYPWLHPKVILLEKQILKKLPFDSDKDLPLANVFIKKFHNKDLHFSPKTYLDDEESYFEVMKDWKETSENAYLQKYPFLGRKDWPVRHEKIYRHKKIVLLR